MNYSASKLASIFGCAVSDIMDINKEILLERSRTQCPLTIPDIIKEFIAVLPTSNFGPWLKINQNFWRETYRELWSRHEKAEEVYDQTVEDSDKAKEKLDEMEIISEDWNEIDAYEIAYEKAFKRELVTFKDLVKVEEALLQCGFVTQESDWGKLRQRYKKRHEDLRAEYWRLVDNLREIGEGFYDEWMDANNAMRNAFFKLAKFEQALLFSDVVIPKDPNYELFIWHMQLYKDRFDPTAIPGINTREDEDAHKWKLPFRFEDELTEEEYYYEFFADV